MAATQASTVVLVRHGETDWARDGRHTGRADVPLNAVGEVQARRLHTALAGGAFQVVFCSTLLRARQTCELAGYAGDDVRYRGDLQEWDYGSIEGRTVEEIQAEQPGWGIWKDALPGGETVAQVGERADRMLEEIRRVKGACLIFAHGHLLRVLAMRWCGLPAIQAQHLQLSPAAISALGSARGVATIVRWNDTGHLSAQPA